MPSAGTNFGPAFDFLRRIIDRDVRGLKAHRLRVHRLIVFFTSDGQPTDPVTWPAAFAALADSAWTARPNVIAFGVGDVDHDTLGRIGTFLGRDGVRMGTALTVSVTWVLLRPDQVWAIHDVSTSGPPTHHTLIERRTPWRSTRGGEPMVGRAELVRELKLLRKGRGLFTGRLSERIGPALRAACEVSDGDGSVAIRQKVATRLAELAEQLPEDLRLATLAAFAINAEARQPLYQDRVLWAAIRVDRDPRTVRRRVDEAINQLAELATGAPRGRPGAQSGGWHTAELRVVAALDRPQPEVLEQRRIVADQDGLRELDLAASLPAGRRDLDIGVFYGGTLVDRGMEVSDRFGFALALPRPLSRGDSHDFAVRFRLTTAQAMRPYLVCVPRRPCELFDLRVRFGRDRVAPRVWTLHGTFQRDVSDPMCHGHQHPVDRAGEIHLRFRQLTPGLAYGARWEADNGAPLCGESLPERR